MEFGVWVTLNAFPFFSQSIFTAPVRPPAFLIAVAIVTALPSSEHSPRYSPGVTSSSSGRICLRASICPFSSA